MKRKTTLIIGITLTLLLLTSGLSFSTIADDPEPTGLEVNKEVKKLRLATGWHDEIEACFGDTVEFRIRVCFHEYDDQHWAEQIEISDTLPSCLKYVETVYYYAPYGSVENLTNIDNTTLIWHFEDDMELWDYDDNPDDYIEIIFKANVIGYGENINTVHVDAVEYCCGTPVSAEDSATVWVQGVEVEKQVMNPDNDTWVDYLDQVVLEDILDFKIAITYHGKNIQTCMEVIDYLPTCCLNYIGNEEFVYPDDDLFEDPDIDPVGDQITWSWGPDILFNLKDGQTIEIYFQANVTQYCGEIVENCVDVDLWGCQYCQHFYGYDCTCINCEQPETNMKKYVRTQDNPWAEEADVVINGTVDFKLIISYYGEENLTDIKIVDYLPEFLAFKDAPDMTYIEVSADKQTIWINFTGVVLEDAESIYVTYTADVLETEEECGQNDAYATGSGDFEDYDYAMVCIVDNTIPCCPLIQGPDNEAMVDEILTFKAKAEDPDGDQVQFKIDWGDEIGDWTSFIDSNVWLEGITHAWDTAGEYIIQIKARDIHGAESAWEEASFPVIITDDDDEEPEPGENISIVAIGKAFRKITATIGNSGEEEVPVNWSITVEGKLLSSKNTNSSGQEDIGGDEEVTVECQLKLLAFGRIDITVEADAGEYGSDSASATAFQLGPFILLLKMA